MLSAARILAYHPALIFDRPWHIVLAKDDPAMRLLLVDSIRGDGHDVQHVSDGAALMNALTTCRGLGTEPDLIVSDVRMPGQSGLEVVRVVRSWGWDTPVIMITAFGDEALKCEAADAGATVLFSKPFDLEDLRTAILHFLPERSGA